MPSSMTDSVEDILKDINMVVRHNTKIPEAQLALSAAADRLADQPDSEAHMLGTLLYPYIQVVVLHQLLERATERFSRSHSASSYRLVTRVMLMCQGHDKAKR